MSYSFEEIATVLEENESEYTTLKFIVDAQLPKKLSHFLVSKGYDSVHTLDLPKKNSTTDNFIKNKAVNENRILITKDDDFLQSFLIETKPTKLILIKTGNISNALLMEIFSKGIDVIASLIKRNSMIEITQKEIIVH